MPTTTTTLGAAALAAGATAVVAYRLLRRVTARHDYPGAPRPDAPNGGSWGAHVVGVRTVTVDMGPGHLDVGELIDSDPGPSVRAEDLPTKPRQLRCEVWYPSSLAKATLCAYRTVLGSNLHKKARPLRPGVLHGRATRDAPVLTPFGQRFPIVVVSHGMVEHRYTLVGLVECLASRGYVVVACEHPDSTNQDIGKYLGAYAFWHHPLDLRFLLSSLQALDDGAGIGEAAASSPFGFLGGCADAQNVGLIGHSMGGYGALCVAGMQPSLQAAMAAPAQIGSQGERKWREEWNPTLEATAPAKGVLRAPPPTCVRCVVPVAPYGMEAGAFSAETLGSVRVPALFVAGDQDRTSYYLRGVRKLWALATGAERWLLTYRGAGHNDVYPFHPPTDEQRANAGDFLAFSSRCWDTRRVCNLNQHLIVRRFPLSGGSMPRLPADRPTALPSATLTTAQSAAAHTWFAPAPRQQGAFLDFALKGDESARRWLDHPLTSGAFDAELPDAASGRRQKWPFNLQHDDDTSAFGFAIEHAAAAREGPREAPASLYRWEWQGMPGEMPQ